MSRIFSIALLLFIPTDLVTDPTADQPGTFPRQTEPSAGAGPSFSQIKLIGATTTEYDNFGFNLSFDGDTVVIGARHDLVNVPAAGAAYVFQRDWGGPDNWGEVQQLSALRDTAIGDSFGDSVSISGNLILVGAPDTDAADTDSGAAYLFRYYTDSSIPWLLEEPLRPGDGQRNDHFGWSVAIDGFTAVVGAHEDDDLASGAGAAYVFEGTLGWVEVAKLHASDGAWADRFGYDVAISGDTILVASRYVASVYVFERNAGGTNKWGETKKLPYLGLSIAIDGDTALIGTPFAESHGAAIVLERDWGGTNNWGLVQTLKASDTANAQSFGRAVAINGDIALVGDKDKGQGIAETGSAHIFKRDLGGTDNWGEWAELLPFDGVSRDNFGCSVAVSGDTFVVGALGRDDAGTLSGGAYVLTESNCGDGVQQPGSPEECDDGTDNSDTEPDACRTDCTFAHCGDEVIDTGEECDAGDASVDYYPGACRADCRFAPYGDGNRDGNANLGDIPLLLWCLRGPATPLPSPLCKFYDWDEDDRTDLFDVANFCQSIDD